MEILTEIWSTWGSTLMMDDERLEMTVNDEEREKARYDWSSRDESRRRRGKRTMLPFEGTDYKLIYKVR